MQNCGRLHTVQEVGSLNQVLFDTVQAMHKSGKGFVCLQVLELAALVRTKQISSVDLTFFDVQTYGKLQAKLFPMYSSHTLRHTQAIHPEDFVCLQVLELAALIRTKQISSVDLTSIFQQRLKR